MFFGYFTERARETAPVHYFANPSTPDVRAQMSAGALGCITTPKQGNRIPARAWYACDNGKFGKGWPGEREWWRWVRATLAHNGPERCAFVTAPDEVCDAAATLDQFERWHGRMLDLGAPIAFVAQNGCEEPGMIPWGLFEVLFLGGDTAWKLGPAARELVTRARWHGLAVHMGRVNSRKRIQYAHAIGCTSADGTYIAHAPAVNLPKALGWSDELADRPALFDLVTVA